MSAASFNSAGLLDRSTSMHTVSRLPMKQSSRISPTVVGEDRTVVADRITAFLRAKHPFKTADNVSADTGIPATTVARWLDRGSAPNAAALCKLVGAYSAEVLCAILDDPPATLVAAARQEERERIERRIAVLRAQIEGGRP